MNLGRQWDSRLKAWDEAFEENLYQPLGALTLDGFTTMDFLTLDEARSGDFRPFPVGTAWGKKWEYGWFRASVRIPDGTAGGGTDTGRNLDRDNVLGKRIMLHIGAAEEMLVYVDGQEAGSIDKAHSLVELTPHTEPGRVYEIYAEAYAGHGVRREDGGIVPRGSVPIPEPPIAQVTVKESHFGIWNEPLFQAYADYHTLYELLKVLPDSSLRGMEIAQGLKEFTYAADFELEEPARTESVVRAAALLRPLLQKKNGDTAVSYTVFGQSHLDLAWLWTSEETKRKSARTYSNQLKLMERYPEYRFLLCCPTVIENLKTYYPDLYRRVKESAAFIPEGAVWIESDTNLPCGESLIRQFVKGKLWFMQEFGVDCKLAWLPDSFGYSAALPQIMAGCRVPYFATQKLLRSDPECDPFPYNNFWWEGLDGTRVLSHVFFDYNANLTPGKLAAHWEAKRNQKEHIDGMLFPFGYGDGGGGPTEIMLETYRRCRDLEGLPRCTMESPVRYFERLEKRHIPEVYYGELYLAWHRGTYTVISEIKRKNRLAESALREAEFLAGLLRLEGRLSDDDALLIDSLWDILLYQEFHDIMAGSSIQRVNEEAIASLDDVRGRCLNLSGRLLRQLAGGPAVFNSLNWTRGWHGMQLPSCGYVVLDDNSGQHGSADPYDLDDPWRDDAGCADDPDDAWRVGDTCTGGPDDAWRVSYDPDTLLVSNRFYTASVDHCGRIMSLTDARTGFEYAESPLNELRMYQDINTYYDAWEISRMYEDVPVPLTSVPAFRWTEERGCLTVYVERREPYFIWKQKIHFRADRPDIVFETDVDWHENHRILKVDFPTGIFTREVLEEIQFGYIRRPTHRSRRYEQDLYETCCHRYAALTDGANGIALINDGKYGLSARDSRMSLTLLRSPAVPDMSADRGQHHFTYVLYPFRGPFQYSGVVQKGYEYNTALSRTADAGKADADIAVSKSYFSTEGSPLILETCKPSMDQKNSVVLRLYEPMGMAGNCRLFVPPQVKQAWQCNMLEEKQSELALVNGQIPLSFRAFEIITIQLSP